MAVILGAFDRAIDSLVNRLRCKIEENDTQSRIIATEWGGGYRLNCDCHEA